MNVKPDQNTFDEVAIIMAIDPAYVEKDWYVTQIVALLSEVKYEGFKLVFTGGTALSKAHHLIQRFSEDLDYRVIAENSMQNRKAFSGFKNYIISKLEKAGIPIPKANVTARNENQFFSISIDYATYYDRKSSLRPHIQVEFSIRSPQLSPCYSAVSSFVNELHKKPAEVHKIACTKPLENAADKLSALSWRIPDRIRNGVYDDPSIVRHIHDLAILGNIALKDPKFRSLVLRSIQSDHNRSKNNLEYPNQTLKEKFAHMQKILDTDKEYLKEYKRFVESMSYAPGNSTPTFASAIKVVKQLANKVVSSA